jgi:hypothetical protein
MHWLLVISAVLACWFALGWIAMNVVLWLFRRGLMPMFGPNTERLVARMRVADHQLDAPFSSNQKRPLERW